MSCEFSPAVMTDLYEYTMLNASLKDGTANRKCIFNIFARHLPYGRRYGVVAGIGRIAEYLKDFRPKESEIGFLRDNNFISDETAKWLENYHFSGTIRAYREGETYFSQSPIVQVEGTFGECVLLETLFLSVLNYDTSVAAAASRMTSAAGGRNCVDMGGRRTEEHSAIAASRSAIIGGFTGTANIAASIKYGLNCIGTAAHAFTLVHDSEYEAFASQVESLGVKTVLLSDTYDIDKAIETAIEIAGAELGGIRIDSGDLSSLARHVRKKLDDAGATKTTVTVTGDLDEYAIAALQSAPIDFYGVGTRLVTGSGHPTSNLVYKLVEREGSDGNMYPVAKKSAGKATVGWRKRPMRCFADENKPAEGSRGGLRANAEIILCGSEQTLNTPDPKTDLLANANIPDDILHGELRDLYVTVVDRGEIDESFIGHDALFRASDVRAQSLETLPIRALSLTDGEDALPVYVQNVQDMQ